MIEVTATFRRGSRTPVTAVVPFGEVPKVGHVVAIGMMTELVFDGPAHAVGTSLDYGEYEVVGVVWYQPARRAGFVPRVELSKT